MNKSYAVAANIMWPITVADPGFPRLAATNPEGGVPKTA